MSKKVILLPNDEAFHPYQIDNTTWEQIQHLTHDLKKRNPLAIEVMNRITIEGMSLGSLSPVTHGHIAKAAMALAGARTPEEYVEKFYQSDHIIVSNCGEGGDINQHLAKQIASARFGVDLDYILEAVIAQFKAAQGVKPGVGGSLSELKVTDLIAYIRNCQPWTALHSPGPHADQYSIEDLALLVHSYLLANPKLLWSIKLASEPGVDTIALGCAKAMGMSLEGRRNDIVITGQGSTGNTPLFTKYHSAFPWLVGLARTHNKLVEAGIRNSITLTASGGFVGSFFKPFLFGADRVGIGTLVLIGDGCIMVRQCHNNTCPTGVATLDPRLIAKNTGGTLPIARVIAGASELTALEMHPYFDHVSQAIGRAPDVLEPILDGPLTGHEEYLRLLKKKPRYISLGNLPPQKGPSYKEIEIIEKIRRDKQTTFNHQADNSELGFGANLSAFSRKDEDVKAVIGQQGVTINITQFPGQNLAVLGAAGITFNASDTHTNDGTGKSLSGGTIVAKTCGAHAGFGMTRGFIATRGVGSRGALRKSGGTFLTEYAGAFFANFHTKGTTVVLGAPSYYPGLVEKGHYKPPFALKEHPLGFGFLSGFSGGEIIMPLLLWQEALHLKHVSPTIKDVVTVLPLNEQDCEALIAALEKSTKYLDSVFQKNILKEIKINRRSINKWFIKIEAPKQKVPNWAVGQIALAEEKLPHPMRKPNISSAISPQHTPEAALVIPPDRERAACGTVLVKSLDGRATHQILRQGVEALIRSSHRGAGTNDPLSGDGCGVMVCFGDGFFQTQPEFASLNLQPKKFAVITVFMPKDKDDFVIAEQALQKSLSKFTLKYAAKRKVPTNEEMLGIEAKFDQLQLIQYIVPVNETQTTKQFDENLSLAYFHFEFTAQQMTMKHRAHCCSASRNVVVYKTKGKEKHISQIYPDLNNPLLTASIVMAHARFKTNTATLIENVQPLSIAMFNGEINDLRRFIEEIKYSRHLAERLQIDLRKIDFSRYSDSAVMAFYMRMLQIFGYSSKQINQAIFHRYDPMQMNSCSEYHNLIGMPGLEGSNGSIRIYEHGDTFKVTVEMDAMGWRPHRGVIDKDRQLLVTGSELGIVPALSGDVIELGPGDALEIDATTSSFKLLRPDVDEQQKYLNKLAQILPVKPSDSYDTTPLTLTLDELKERKLRAGITPEIEATFLTPMFNDGNGFTVSMGDDGGPEVTVSGPTRVINTVKTSFAQITRPPLDYHREGEVMSGNTFIGGKPAINDLHYENTVGLRVDNPIIDNEQLRKLQNSPNLKSVVIDIIYPVRGREAAMLSALGIVRNECIEAAKKGITFIVLSDIKSDAIRAPILPMLVAGVVDTALKQNGLRHKVTVCLQSSACVTPLEQIAVIACGVNVVNPYLIFIPDKLFATNKSEFARQRKSYQRIALKEILAASARAGVRTLSAGYTGARLITALGLDKTVSDAIGIYSELGGFDWANIAAATVDMHMRPSSIGKYPLQGQITRLGRWNVALVSHWRSLAKGEKTLKELLPAMMPNIRSAERENLEGWYMKKPPMIWTIENPLRIIIVGGGAAGINQAKALLNSPMGKKIIVRIIEENPANLFGMVKDGIAPDKLETRRMQFKLLSECLNDSRVQYYGGVVVGKVKEGNVNVTFDELNNDSPCVIDARGAPRDRKLTEVEGHEHFTSASDVWKAYNGYFDPYNPNRYWPFHATRSQVKVVVGNGNVAADIIRLLLSDPDHLETAGVHPAFQERLRREGPKLIRNIARGPVTQCKITLKELQSFEEKGIRVCAEFDESRIDESTLSEEQLEKLQFFRRVKMNDSNLLESEKCVHFHFGCAPKKLSSVGRNIFELLIEHENGKTESFRGGDVISAVGSEKPSEEFVTPFVVGWASGNGGNLSIIQKSVEENTAKILAYDEERKFDHIMGPPPERKWQSQATVTNKGFLNIISYYIAGNPLDTIEQWRKARDYHEEMPKQEQQEQPPQVPVTEPATKKVAIPTGSIKVVDKNNTKQSAVFSLEPQSNTTIYRALKKAAQVNNNIPVPQNECDESGSCIRCVAEVSDTSSKQITQTPLEKSILPTLFGRQGAARKFLTCQHSANEVDGLTIEVEYSVKNSKNTGP